MKVRQEMTDAALERDALLAIRELLKRKRFDLVKRICWANVFVEEHEQGFRYVDARSLSK